MSVIERLDRFQRTHPRTGMAIAVVYKFVDDQGTYLAALITFYGFLSLVPLLLLASTVLDFVLEGHPHLQMQLLDSVLGQFPIVGDHLEDPNGITGSGFGLAVGIIGTVFGSLGVAQAAQNAMNTIWRVPRNARPNPVKARLRSLLLLSIVGLAIIATTGLAAFGSTVDLLGAGLKVIVGLGTLAINAAVFTIAFRLATAAPLTVRQALPGAVGAAVVWQVLQYTGAFYVGHVVAKAREINSFFALVLGLVAWLYLEAIVVILAVEYNSVRALRLHPRALMTPFTDDVDLTAADEANYTQQAQAQRAKGFEQITVRFDPPP